MFLTCYERMLTVLFHYRFQATKLIRQAEEASDHRVSGNNPNHGRRTHIPILAMTADVIQATSDECLRCGMDGYVAKPFDEQQLYSAVARFFQAD
jgi:histidine kinase 2/3/4 (cytokinin receptor)